jgi:hypothetical protein
VTAKEKDRPDNDTGPAQQAHASKLSDQDNPTRGYGLELLAEDERRFVTDLDALQCALWVCGPSTDGKGEFARPKGWQNTNVLWNMARLEPFKLGHCICVNTGGPLIVVDVDRRNGGDIEAVRQWLDGLGVRVFAEVITPSSGRRFYVSGGRLDIQTVHGKLPGLPGVDLQSKGANVFVPGTRRPKYGGKGYQIMSNDLQCPRSCTPVRMWAQKHWRTGCLSMFREARAPRLATRGTARRPMRASSPTCPRCSLRSASLLPRRIGVAVTTRSTPLRSPWVNSSRVRVWTRSAPRRHCRRQPSRAAWPTTTAWSR